MLHADYGTRAAEHIGSVPRSIIRDRTVEPHKKRLWHCFLGLASDNGQLATALTPLVLCLGYQ